MAILFYDDIALDKQEIQNFSVEKLSTTAIGNLGSDAKYQGRLVYDNLLNVLQYYTGSSWVLLDGTGNIDTVDGGLGVVLAGDGTNVGAVTLAVDYSTGASNVVLAAPTTAGALALDSQILASVGTAVKAFSLTTLKGALQAGVSSISATASTYITTGIGVSGGANTITASLAAGEGVAGAYLNASGSGTWSVPSGNEDSLYALVASTSTIPKITLDASGTGAGVDSAFFIAGIANQITSTQSGQTITLGLPSAVTMPGTLKVDGTTTLGGAMNVTGASTFAGGMTISGAATFNAIPTLANGNTNPPHAKSIVSKGYVDSLVAGGLNFRGGYDAATDALTGNPGLLETVPAAGSNYGANILKGYTYVVTVGGAGLEGAVSTGAFWAPVLAAGDLIIAKQDTPTTAAHWVAVQKNVTTATASVAGLAYFPSGNGFAAPTATGAISLKTQTPYTAKGSATKIPQITTDAYGAVETITEVPINIPTTAITNFATNVTTSLATYSHTDVFSGTGNAGTIADPFVSTHAIPTAAKVTCQVYQTLVAAGTTGTVGATVYPKIVRTGQTVTVGFKNAPLSGSNYQLLIIGTIV